MGKSTIIQREDGTPYVIVFLAEDSEAVDVGNGFDKFEDTDEGTSDALVVRVC